jgi:hypothetical protein
VIEKTRVASDSIELLFGKVKSSREGQVKYGFVKKRVEHEKRSDWQMRNHV